MAKAEIAGNLALHLAVFVAIFVHNFTQPAAEILRRDLVLTLRHRTKVDFDKNINPSELRKVFGAKYKCVQCGNTYIHATQKIDINMFSICIWRVDKRKVLHTFMGRTI